TMLGAGRSAILSGVGAAANAVLSWDPPSLAGKLLLKGILPYGFPAGLDAMRTDSGLVEGLRAMTEEFSMRTWGGVCDIDNLHDGGVARVARDAIHGAFRGKPNDTVVDADSATGAGTPVKVIPRCSHFEYFLQPEVVAEIQALE